ncbi:uncharacterized protein YcbK (DUF882 family) [Geothermobacter ehrlichii]|uniref:Murein endopeptidase K n=1 Tax=Geothermobacter ehrlichii TaxID=213224 RepID=A0A5D3WMQ8_9BACT|nr:DUF882 domain-containing protein [Geothermobacter ehrlichii]TYP00283.1 uncharacterized protein YcbK (DUF882 family) [Geothermobacter ehrlichii]
MLCSLALLLPVPVFARVGKDLTSTRCLSLHNLHTGERLRNVPYCVKGTYQVDVLAELNHLLRDYRTGEVTTIDPRLFDLLYLTESNLGVCTEIEVISGYRSPATNALLRRRSKGVAKNSLHMQGRAIDIRLPGCGLKRLHRAAVELRLGGVGYYPKSNFVHLDTGRFRLWQGV